MKNKELFLNFLKENEQIMMKYNKKINCLGMCRLIVFIIFAVIIVKNFYSGFNSLDTLIAFCLLIIFFQFYFMHNRCLIKIKKSKVLININEQYVKRFNGDFYEFTQDGSEYVDNEHEFSSDLDIFGKKSLFQYINITKTFLGKTFLADVLLNSRKDINEIKNKQTAISELSKKIDFIQLFLCESNLSQDLDKNPKDIIQYFKDENYIFLNSKIKMVFYFLPLLTLTCLIVLIINFNLILFFFLGLILLLQAIIILINKKKMFGILQNINYYKNQIQVLNKLIKVINKEDFNSNYLKELKSNLINSHKKMNSLNNISSFIDFKYSPVLYILLNLFVMWDFYCILALERWKCKVGDKIELWYNSIAYFEAFISLSNIQILNDNWTLPDINQTIEFKALNMGHPLIKNEQRIYNSIEFNNILIITGSNMSGKTTFLRTIGINLVLSYAGCAVCADNFSCPVLDIFTSMRIRDNLTGGISTFYAELIRIKKMIENIEKKTPMIFLIDEIFRGTNSNDRIAGAVNVLMQLNKPWIIGLISTHDFELCELEFKNRKFMNYHFEEKYVDGKIEFDYKLYKGKCITQNARYLMKMVGIQLEY